MDTLPMELPGDENIALQEKAAAWHGEVVELDPETPGKVIPQGNGKVSVFQPPCVVKKQPKVVEAKTDTPHRTEVEGSEARAETKTEANGGEVKTEEKVCEKKRDIASVETENLEKSSTAVRKAAKMNTDQIQDQPSQAEKPQVAPKTRKPRTNDTDKVDVALLGKMEVSCLRYLKC